MPETSAILLSCSCPLADLPQPRAISAPQFRQSFGQTHPTVSSLNEVSGRGFLGYRPSVTVLDPNRAQRDYFVEPNLPVRHPAKFISRMTGCQIVGHHSCAYAGSATNTGILRSVRFW